MSALLSSQAKGLTYDIAQMPTLEHLLTCDFPVTSAATTSPKVLRCQWKERCDTNGRCIAVQLVQMGGVLSTSSSWSPEASRALQCTLEVYCSTSRAAGDVRGPSHQSEALGGGREGGLLDICLARKCAHAHTRHIDDTHTHTLAFPKVTLLFAVLKASLANPPSPYRIQKRHEPQICPKFVLSVRGPRFKCSKNMTLYGWPVSRRIERGNQEYPKGAQMMSLIRPVSQIRPVSKQAK